MEGLTEVLDQSVSRKDYMLKPIVEWTLMVEISRLSNSTTFFHLPIQSLGI